MSMLNRLMGKVNSKLTEDQKNARDTDRIIMRQMLTDQKAESRKVKILLLGTGESGKSTIFKQVRELYGDNKYDRRELKLWVTLVYENINKQILTILEAGKKFGIPLANADLARPFGKKYTITTVVNKDVASKIKELWADPGFQLAWARRADYQVLECIEYYMANIDRIADNPGKFIPTFQDVVHARVRTTGIVMERFRIRRAPFEMYDVGGQRNERKKWLNCFNNVTTVIFVVAINEYDQTLFEDHSVNRMEEASKVWKDVVNRDEFKSVGFVLFLNKFDLFQEKVTEFPFRTEDRHTDYVGADPMECKDGSQEQEQAILECAEFMKRKFMTTVNYRKGKGGAVNAFFTNATDSNNIKHVFDTCEEQLLRLNLSDNGFGPLKL